MAFLVETSGWCGTFLIILAYYLVSNNKFSATDRRYQLLNIFGAAGVGINAFVKGAWPVLALEIAWIMIAVLAITRQSKKSISPP